MALKAAEIIVTCTFDELFIKSIGKQQMFSESSGKYSMRRSRVLYLSQDPHQELYLSYKQSVSALSVLLYFTPINV